MKREIEIVFSEQFEFSQQSDESQMEMTEEGLKWPCQKYEEKFGFSFVLFCFLKEDKSIKSNYVGPSKIRKSMRLQGTAMKEESQH